MIQQMGCPIGHPNPHGFMHTKSFHSYVKERLYSVEKKMHLSGMGKSHSFCDKKRIAEYRERWIEEDKINTIIEWMNWFLLYKLAQD